MTRISGPYGVGNAPQHAVFGLAEHGDGKVALYGDSNCLDSSHQRSNCFGMLKKTIEYVTEVSKFSVPSDYTSLAFWSSSDLSHILLVVMLLLGETRE